MILLDRGADIEARSEKVNNNSNCHIIVLYNCALFEGAAMNFPRIDNIAKVVIVVEFFAVEFHDLFLMYYDLTSLIVLYVPLFVSDRLEIAP